MLNLRFQTPETNSRILRVHALIRITASMGLFCALLFSNPAVAALSDLFKSPLDRLIAALEHAEGQIGTVSSSWQNTLPKMQDQFTESEKKILADSLNKVKNIADEGTQLLAEQGKCTVDYVAKDVRLQVQSLIHTLKKDGLAKQPDPVICAITPQPMDMASLPPTLRISGAWFNASNEPSVFVENSAGGKKLIDANYLSLVTPYAMTVRLDLLEQAHLIGKDTRRLHVSFANQPGFGEVEVVALNTCFDEIRNQDESDVDCGGVCGRCAAKKRCNKDADCAGSTCLSQVCGVHQLGAQTPNVFDFGGGSVGQTPADANCPAGFVATGFWAHTGDYFNQLSLICQKINDNGTLDPNDVVTKTVGGNAPGPHPLSAHCDQGAALIGFLGHTGALINELTGRCESPYDAARWNSEGTNPPAESQTGAMKVHPEGNEAKNACPQGAFVSGLHLMTGAFIDHVAFRCTMVSRVALP